MKKEKTGMACLEDLEKLVRTLRGPEGCPWDRAQRITDMKQYLPEECYEVLDAIDFSPPEKLKEELGDLLFHIVFIAQVADERGDFSLGDVLTGIHTKMVHRHPHVFGSASAEDPEAVRKNWWKIKQKEGTTSGSHLEGVPRHLPALQRAYRLGQRASRWASIGLNRNRSWRRSVRRSTNLKTLSRMRQQLGFRRNSAIPSSPWPIWPGS